MTGTVVVHKTQVGQSNTAANNFTIRTLDDGSLRVSRGNAGAEISDVLVINASGNFSTAPVLGVGQTWQNVTSSRAVDTTYTNTTGRAIEVMVGFIATSSSSVTVVLNGLPRIGNSSTGMGGDDYCGLSFIVPAGSTYRIETTSGTLTWLELR